MEDIIEELYGKAELYDVICQELSFLGSIYYKTETEEKIRISNMELCKRFLNHVDN